jgi:hypothetical protein
MSSEIFLVYIQHTINAHTFACRVAVVLLVFHTNLNFLTTLKKTNIKFHEYLSNGRERDGQSELMKLAISRKRLKTILFAKT